VRWPWQRATSVSPFVPQPGAGLHAEHGVVSRWVEEAVRALDDQHSYQDVELKSQPSGRIMLDATPDEQFQRGDVFALSRKRLYSAEFSSSHFIRGLRHTDADRG
jgi:hypothetical protein